ncbi:MAG: helix-turn-helix domain-containing protein [Bacillota bacterium]|nr:helix-turn-helix domain-containing protein [Bacillota bacterium]
MVNKVFQKNAWFFEIKEGIPYYAIANKLGVHKNTLRNWIEREMAPEMKTKVLHAISEIKEELANVQ